MGWIDDLLTNVRDLLNGDGVAMARRSKLAFSSQFSLTDEPSTDKTHVAIVSAPASMPVVVVNDDNDGETLAAGYTYFAQNSVPITLYLPGAVANEGRALAFINGGGVDVALLPSVDEACWDIDTQTNFTPTNYGVLPGGRNHWYEFRSLGYNIGAATQWTRRRINASSRKSIDVRFLALAPLPAYTETGTGYPRFTADVDGALVVDGNTPSVGDLIAVPFNPSYGCIVRVVQVGDGSSPWVLECESTVAYGNHEVCATLVRVTDGDYGREREFYIGPGTKERATSLLYGATARTGTFAAYPGKIQLLDVTSNVVVNLASIYSPVQEGMLFGIKVTVDGGDVTVTPTASSQIEDPATGALGSTMTVAAVVVGLCCLWKYDSNADAWRVVVHG